jgi:hypothetical protein
MTSKTPNVKYIIARNGSQPGARSESVLSDSQDQEVTVSRGALLKVYTYELLKVIRLRRVRVGVVGGALRDQHGDDVGHVATVWRWGFYS